MMRSMGARDQLSKFVLHHILEVSVSVWVLRFLREVEVQSDDIQVVAVDLIFFDINLSVFWAHF